MLIACMPAVFFAPLDRGCRAGRRAADRNRLHILWWMGSVAPDDAVRVFVYVKMWDGG